MMQENAANYMICRNSHPLGKGEVECSIHSGSTIQFNSLPRFQGVRLAPIVPLADSKPGGTRPPAPIQCVTRSERSRIARSNAM